MKSLTCIALAALVLSSAVALAADTPQAGGARGACKADAEKFCSGVQHGGGRIAACLKQNEAQVSAACRDAKSKARDRKAPAAPAVPTVPQG